MTTAVIAPPSCEPLDIAEVKLHLKQDIDDDDPLIAAYLASARAYAENVCSKRLVSAGLALRLEHFPCDGIRLVIGPVVAVDSIQYLDTSGVLQTLPDTDYRVDAFSIPARIKPAIGKVWPATMCQEGAVIVTYKAGYLARAIFDATENTVSVENWRPLQVGDSIRLANSGGALPSGLQGKTWYYIQAVIAPGVYTLTAAPGGSVIDLTNTGSGLHFLGQPGINWSAGDLPGTIKAWLLVRTDTAYSHRGENVNTRGGEITPLPYVDRLLDNDRIW